MEVSWGSVQLNFTWVSPASADSLDGCSGAVSLCADVVNGLAYHEIKAKTVTIAAIANLWDRELEGIEDVPPL